MTDGTDVPTQPQAETAIRRLCRERSERIGRREFDEMVEAFYDEDAVLLPSGAATVHGLDAVRDFWRRTPAEGLVSLTLDTLRVEASGGLAYEIGSFSRTLRRRHGAPFQEHGKYLVVYRLGSGSEYRAIAEMFNSDARR